ncbi:MAG: hypothetical protein JNL57_06495 [Bacteroidetes bacterium]|nr:hypothetical protein [Bacteroidota bacterium]
MKQLTLLLLLTAALPLSAQHREWRGGALLSNQVVSFPVTGFPSVFRSAIHPGLDGYLETRLNKKEHNQFVLQLGLGVLYHRFFQTAIKLYPWLDYRYAPKGPWKVSVGLGAGYQHSFPAYGILRKNAAGEWVQIPAWHGRPQFIAGAGLGVSRAMQSDDPDGIRWEFRLRSSIQTPFAKSYIPMIPYNSVMLGLSLPVQCKGGKK